MKILSRLCSALIVLVLIVSCSGDDGGGTVIQNNNLDVIGIWDLTQVNISAAQDVDMDGNSSSNLIDEVSCISGTLLIDADFTWSFEQTEVTITGITGGLFFAQCGGTSSASGTWTSNTSQVTFSGSSTLDNLSIVGETLVNNINEDLPSVRSFVYERRP